MLTLLPSRIEKTGVLSKMGGTTTGNVGGLERKRPLYLRGIGGSVREMTHRFEHREKTEPGIKGRFD